MKRICAGYKLQKQRNEEIRKRTAMEDVIECITKFSTKWKWNMQERVNEGDLSHDGPMTRRVVSELDDSCSGQKQLEGSSRGGSYPASWINREAT